MHGCVCVRRPVCSCVHQEENRRAGSKATKINLGLSSQTILHILFSAYSATALHPYLPPEPYDHSQIPHTLNKSPLAVAPPGCPGDICCCCCIFIALCSFMEGPGFAEGLGAICMKRGGKRGGGGT